MVLYSDFDEAFSTPLCNQSRPTCVAPNCFMASYPPITPAGQVGQYFVNTKFLQPNRYAETVGPVLIRSEDLKCTF
jgi:hypothetical protein